MSLAAIELGTVLILVVLVALPLGALAFAMGAGNALRQIGKGDFAIEQEMPQHGGSGAPPAVSEAVREEEIRQMVEARSYRRVARGEEALDVDAEVEKLLRARGGGTLGHDAGLREEIRQLVVARNERLERQGKKALDVDEEIERQLSELENLGQ
jgi:hypothetical protein